MKRIAYGILSSLLILTATVPVKAETPSTIAQSNSATIDQMFREQRVLTNEIQALTAQMKMLMAEMKALTAIPEGQMPTMADLYKQQQVLMAQVESLTDRTRLETILNQKSPTTATVQDVYKQQAAMLTELKAMTAELKSAIGLYRNRIDTLRR